MSLQARRPGMMYAEAKAEKQKRKESHPATVHGGRGWGWSSGRT